MRTMTASARAAVFLVLAPGAVAGLVPWWLTGWRAGAAYPAAARTLGAVLIAAGAAALLTAFAQSAIQGRGTPAPAAPTEHLVARGLYRRYGADYEAYRQAVPGWWPRLRLSPRSCEGVRR